MTRTDLEEQLKAAIKANGKREITGPILQRVLLLITGYYVHVDEFVLKINELVAKNKEQDGRLDSIEAENQGQDVKIETITDDLEAIHNLSDGFLVVEGNEVKSTNIVDGGDF